MRNMHPNILMTRLLIKLKAQENEFITFTNWDVKKEIFLFSFFF
jgi:hypothetical protein